KIERGQTVDIAQVQDINSVTGLFKQFLRELPVPLVPFNFFELFLAVFSVNSTEFRNKYLSILVWGLPGPHRVLLLALLRLLGEVCALSEANKMTPQNLAVVFAPTILRPQDEDPMLMVSQAQHLVNVMEMMIQHADVIVTKPLVPYHGIAKCISSHLDGSTEFLQFKAGDLLWIQSEAPMTGWWIGHQFSQEEPVATFPNRSVDIIAEFVERQPVPKIRASPVIPRRLPAGVASAISPRPPPPSAAKPALQNQKTDILVDLCIELCAQIETLKQEISSLRAHNQALADHVQLPAPALLPPASSSPSGSSADSDALKGLLASLQKMKTPVRPPPTPPGPSSSDAPVFSQHQRLLSEIQNSSRASEAAPTPTSSHATGPDPAASPRSSGPPPPLPQGLPPPGPPPQLTPGRGTPTPGRTTPTPEKSESEDSEKIEKIEKTEKTEKKASSRRKTKSSSQKSSSGSTRRRPTSHRRSTMKVETSADGGSSAGGEAAPISDLERSGSTESLSVALASDATPASTAPSTDAPPAAVQRAPGLEEEEEEVLVACWNCDTINPWDGVSSEVTCIQCGEKSFLDFEE
ncbi:MAG: hypothetical protein Q8P67_03400, partial [archaeon]|nr:hypothetical protein [archaeon]